MDRIGNGRQSERSSIKQKETRENTGAKGEDGFRVATSGHARQLPFDASVDTADVTRCQNRYHLNTDFESIQRTYLLTEQARKGIERRLLVKNSNNAARKTEAAIVQ